jgi:circadian clock protein KaiB
MSGRAMFKFRLYVAGDADNATQAVANLGALCRDHLANRHHIEVIDVFLEPQRALADGVFMTPTLVKLSPSPTRRIVGTLSQREPVMRALGLIPLTS